MIVFCLERFVKDLATCFIKFLKTFQNDENEKEVENKNRLTLPKFY